MTAHRPPPRDPLDGLRAFASVAEFASFTAAGARLGITASAVSRTVRLLEARLGQALFNRTTRAVRLTEAGERLLERVRPALQALDGAMLDLADRAERPWGTLRLAVSRSGFLLALQPVLADYLAQCPEVNLEISVGAALVDSVGDGFDAGIRLASRVERDMVAVSIGPMLANCLVAAPAYLELRGRPSHPRELALHDGIVYRFPGSGQLERWEFTEPAGGGAFAVSPRRRLVLDDMVAMLGAARAGAGIANAINADCEADLAAGRLVQLLAPWTTPMPRLALYYPDRRRVPAKLRALIALLRADAAP